MEILAGKSLGAGETAVESVEAPVLLIEDNDVIDLMEADGFLCLGL
jgi:hypothetical protein